MNTRHFSQLPKAYLAYPKVIQGLVFKKPKGERVLPKVEYVVDSFRIDQDHLNDYNQVCGFKSDDTIPAIYLAVLSQSLQMHMMTTENFPLRFWVWCIFVIRSSKLVQLALMKH